MSEVHVPADGMLLSLWKGLIPAARPFPMGTENLTSRKLNDALWTVYDATGITPDEIMSKSRRAPIAHARQMAMYLLRQQETCAGKPRYSYPEIGKKLGGLDHTTVMWGVRKHEARLFEAMERAACVPCNLSKKDKSLGEWRQ